MTTDRYAACGAMLQIGMLADRLSGIVRLIARPSLVQLVLRFGLAVPFWRSGILKWDGFLQLNDTAIDLFTSEFMLHLPGGPYPYPAPATMRRGVLLSKRIERVAVRQVGAALGAAAH